MTNQISSKPIHGSNATKSETKCMHEKKFKNLLQCMAKIKLILVYYGMKRIDHYVKNLNIIKNSYWLDKIKSF